MNFIKYLKSKLFSLAILLMIIHLFLFSSNSYSVEIIPSLGEQRIGTSCLSFLKIGIGARAVSMGGAYVSNADDISALYWNPAGLVQIPHQELTFSHIDWLVDVDIEYLGYAKRIRDNIMIGTFLQYLHIADMETTTEYHPFGTGEYFSYYDLITGITASTPIVARCLNVKFVP